MKLLRFALAIAILHLSAAVAYCDQASKDAKVEEYFKVLKMEELVGHAMDLVQNQIKSGVMQQLMGVTPPAESKKSLEEFQEKLMTIITGAVSWEKLKPAYVKMYSDAYTEEELDGIVAFYKSPAGQAMVAKTPGMMTAGNELAQQRIKEVAPQLQQLMRDFIAQLHQQPKQ